MVRTLPTSTTNMTGFLAISRGSSLRRLSSERRPQERPFPGGDGAHVLVAHGSEHLSGLRQEVLDDRAQAEGREERQGAHDHDHAHEQGREERARWSAACPGPGGTDFLPGQDARRWPARARSSEAPDQHGQAEGDVVPGRVGVEPGERRAVVAGGAGEGVEDLAEAVGPRVVERRERRRARPPTRRRRPG